MCALKTIQTFSKNVQKWFKIVAKIIQNRGLEEAWAVLGAYRGVLVVSWGLLGAFWGVLGTSWDVLGGVLGASWGVLGVSWDGLGASRGRLGGVLGNFEASLRAS